MAWDWYLNIEPIALGIARDNANRMTDENLTSEQLNEIRSMAEYEPFLENLRYGFSAIVMASCYFEACVNTLLRVACGCKEGDSLLRDSIERKLQHLFQGKEERLAELKRSLLWNDYIRLQRVRNDLVHYKVSVSNTKSSWPPLNSWTIGKERVIQFFTRANVLRMIESLEDMVSFIASSAGAGVNGKCSAFSADEYGGIGSYFFPIGVFGNRE